MAFYWVKTHWLMKKLFSQYVWDIPAKEKIVYLTFDDGPTPEITEWVLSQLEHYNAKATFFCIGNNIANHRGIYEKVINAGHAIGNHTYNHVNGWKTDYQAYLDNVALCESEMENRGLFRPPYGKIKRSQSKTLRGLGYQIIMWDILSADFDRNITKEKCLDNVIRHINPGSVVIFHDSVKAFPNLEYALPKTLQFLKENGYRCEVIA
jgi:peptidoglycan/xylan/chitin deacetylase (PgdA/CDA1 family)